MVESIRPDVVVLDVMLPDVGGFTVLKRLRDRGSSTQVIFLTARDATEDRVRGLTTASTAAMHPAPAARSLKHLADAVAAIV